MFECSHSPASIKVPHKNDRPLASRNCTCTIPRVPPTHHSNTKRRKVPRELINMRLTWTTLAVSAVVSALAARAQLSPEQDSGVAPDLEYRQIVSTSSSNTCSPPSFYKRIKITNSLTHPVLSYSVVYQPAKHADFQTVAALVCSAEPHLGPGQFADARRRGVEIPSLLR